MISTLEAPAVLLSLKLFHGETPLDHRTRVLVAPTWTDNRGNGAALNNLMTTKFPASAVIMELTAYMKKMLLKVQVDWSPRSGHVEAGSLANGIHDSFDPALGVNVDPGSISWELLPQALEAGRAAEKEHAFARLSGTIPNRGKRQRKRKPEERLKMTDPW